MQYLFISFKSFVVFCAFDPWHLGLVAFWHGTSGVNHLSRVPFPGQDLTFCLSAHYKTSISTVEGKKNSIRKKTRNSFIIPRIIKRWSETESFTIFEMKIMYTAIRKIFHLHIFW